MQYLKETYHFTIYHEVKTHSIPSFPYDTARFKNVKTSWTISNLISSSVNFTGKNDKNAMPYNISMVYLISLSLPDQISGGSRV